jgi:hypothetical protein
MIILVMPFLRDWGSPDLTTVGEAMDLFGQLFEVCLHNNDPQFEVFHSCPPDLRAYNPCMSRTGMYQSPALCPIMNHFRRDISILNFMMDGSMYPNSWHPCDDEMERLDLCVEAKHYTRSERPPRYYLIDFGISHRYDPKDGPPLEPPIFGGDKSVSEFQKSVDPCNPFPTDIYYAGSFILQGLMKVRSFFLLVYFIGSPSRVAS